MSKKDLDPNWVDVLKLATNIVIEFQSGGNSLTPPQAAELISKTALALTDTLQNGHPILTPAVPVEKSITPDFIICLEDGKKFKTLKRHLRAEYDLSPEEYRKKWGLPEDYPIVAPNYAKARSKLAKKMKLGQRPIEKKQTSSKKTNGARNPKTRRTKTGAPTTVPPH